MRTLQRLSQVWYSWVSAPSRCSRRSCSFSLALFYQPASHSDFYAGFWVASQRCRDRLFSYFCLQRDCTEAAFTKEASLYLVVSAGLLAILLTASRQFSWLDVCVSTAAMLPVGLGMYVGQQMRDQIAPETFKKLVLITVIKPQAPTCCDMVSSVDGLAKAAAWGTSGSAANHP